MDKVNPAFWLDAVRTNAHTTDCREKSQALTNAAHNLTSYIDQLRQRLAETNEYAERCTEANRQAELDNDELRAKLALAEQDARRLDWLEAHPNELRFEPFSRSGRAWACCPSTKIGNDGRPHSDVDRFATARAAIDAAIASQHCRDCNPDIKTINSFKAKP